MSNHDHLPQERSAPESFWKSRSGVALMTFLAVAGLLLAYEHRVHVFTGNGILIGLLALCVGMHLFMHKGHVGDGSGHRHGGPSDGGKN